VTLAVEAVGKVNFGQILRHGKKCNLSGSSVNDDLMLGRGQGPLKIISLIAMLGFFYRLVSPKITQ
jgi:hypothetical protein